MHVLRSFGHLHARCDSTALLHSLCKTQLPALHLTYPGSRSSTSGCSCDAVSGPSSSVNPSHKDSRRRPSSTTPAPPTSPSPASPLQSDPWAQGVFPANPNSGPGPSQGLPRTPKDTTSGTQQRRRPGAAAPTKPSKPPPPKPPSPAPTSARKATSKTTVTAQTASSSQQPPISSSTPPCETPPPPTVNISIIDDTSSSSVLHLTQVAGAPSATSQQHEACFEAAVASHGLSQTQVKQLLTYLDYMLETNKVMNLTAVRDRSEALTRHLVDSLALLPVIEGHRPGSSQAPLTVIDVGTGAGLPGMVLAVARPHWKVTLLDTLRKRCDFLQRAAQVAGLSNVDVVWSRAEEGAGRPDLRERFDLSVARAVADARVLAELCLPYVKPDGLWVAAKGPNSEVEVSGAANAIQLLGGAPAVLERVISFSGDGQRTALVVHKLRSTPKTYPRSPGTITKSPL